MLEKIYHLLITIITIALVIELLGLIIPRVNLLDPIEYSIEHFNYTDLYYSKFKYDTVKTDEDIVLVNIGIIPRPAIAKQIMNICAANPKVIGLDLFFYDKRDASQDSLLIAAVNQCQSDIVFSVRLLRNTETDAVDSVRHTHQQFLGNREEGSANINWDIEDPRIGSARFVIKDETVDERTYYPLAYELAKKYNSEKAYKFLGHLGDLVYIDFKRNIHENGGYEILDVHEVLSNSFDPSIVEGKVVIFCYLGDYLGDRSSLEDKFFSPLNESFFGRFPDMFGGVIQANVLSMILSGNYIFHNQFISRFIIILLVVLFYLFFQFIYNRFNHQYQILSKVLSFVLINLILVFLLYIYAEYRIFLEINYVFVYLILLPDAVEIMEKNFIPSLDKMIVLVRSKFYSIAAKK